MIEVKALLVVLFVSILIDVFGDYLWCKGMVKSVYVGRFHVDHELAYLSIPAYLILAWFSIV